LVAIPEGGYKPAEQPRAAVVNEVDVMSKKKQTQLEQQTEQLPEPEQQPVDPNPAQLERNPADLEPDPAKKQNERFGVKITFDDD
jgi:hypothetical protein